MKLRKARRVSFRPTLNIGHEGHLDDSEISGYRITSTDNTALIRGCVLSDCDLRGFQGELRHNVMRGCTLPPGTL